jgi:hypothetical protein
MFFFIDDLILIEESIWNDGQVELFLLIFYIILLVVVFMVDL